MTIYNLLGQKVILLVDQVQAAGRYEAVWNGTNLMGAGVASGIYLYRIVSGSGYTDSKRMTLLKVGKRNTWRYGTLIKPCNPLVVNMFYGLVKLWC